MEMQVIPFFTSQITPLERIIQLLGKFHNQKHIDLNIFSAPCMWCLVGQQLQILDCKPLHGLPGVIFQVLQQKLDLQENKFIV